MLGFVLLWCKPMGYLKYACYVGVGLNICFI